MMRIALLIFSILSFSDWSVLVLPARAQGDFIRQRETNPNYQEGDWVSYSVARFITSIAVGQQYVYFGTRHSGIIRLDQYQYRWDFPWTTSNGLADNQVWSVAYDHESGFLWCASHRAISYYQPTAHKWHNYFKDEFGLPFNDEIESIGIGPRKIYFQARSGRVLETNKFGGIILVSNSQAGSNGSVRWFGRRAQRQRRFPNFFMSHGYLFNPEGVVEDFNFRRAEVVAAVEDDWGNLWIGTWGLGAGRGDLRNLQLDMYEFGLSNFSVQALTLADEVLWLGGTHSSETQRGITAWDLGRETWSTYEQRNISELRSDQIYAITADNDDLWFSTGYGLVRYSSRKGSWQTFDSFEGLSDNLVFDAVADDSCVWIATSNGIDRLLKNSLSKKDSVKIKPISPGNLALTRVRDLELMENLLWAATNRGVYVYDTAKRVGGFSDEFEGPITDEITSISSYQNELWLGSTDGVDVFDTKKRQWLGVTEGRLLSTSVNKVLATPQAVWAATNSGVMKFNRKDKTWRKFTVKDGLIDNRVHAILLDGDYIWFGTERGLTQFYWNDPSRID
ncbi:MAG: two-component regulator propeller domain-containing protein [bacterium]